MYYMYYNWPTQKEWRELIGNWLKFNCFSENSDLVVFGLCKPDTAIAGIARDHSIGSHRFIFTQILSNLVSWDNESRTKYGQTARSNERAIMSFGWWLNNNCLVWHQIQPSLSSFPLLGGGIGQCSLVPYGCLRIRPILFIYPGYQPLPPIPCNVKFQC